MQWVFKDGLTDRFLVGDTMDLKIKVVEETDGFENIDLIKIGDIINNIRKWTINVLVFWGIFKILFFIFKDIIFQYITFPEPLNAFLQIASLGIVVLLTFIFTSLLVKGNNKNEIF